MTIEAESEDQPASLRERQKAFTRRQLLEAATEEFASRGYLATTVEDIAARAGASRATFYMHFASKAEVLSEIGDATRPEIDDHYRRLDAALATGSPADLREWFEYMFEQWDRHQSLVPAWEQAIAIEPAFREKASEFIWHLPDVMTAYLERWPEEEREQARFRILLLESQLSRFMSRQLAGRSEQERHVILDVMTDIWYHALHAERGTSA